MKSRLGSLQNSAPFTQLFEASELSETPVKVRIPQVFKASYFENSPHPDDGQTIRPERVQPPFLPLPGFKLCYEQSASYPDGSLPYYCYLASFQAGPGQANTVMGDIQAKLAKEFPNSGANWIDETVKTAAGADLTWKKISVVGEMLFDGHAGDGVGNNTEFKKLPGKFELWMYQANGWVTLVGWREPDAIAQVSELSELAPLTAGSIEVGEAAAAK